MCKNTFGGNINVRSKFSCVRSSHHLCACTQLRENIVHEMSIMPKNGKQLVTMDCIYLYLPEIFTSVTSLRSRNQWHLPVVGSGSTISHGCHLQHNPGCC